MSLYYFRSMKKITRTVDRRSYAVKFEARDGARKIAWGYLYIIFQDRHREPYGLMENIYVEKEYRGGGVGSGIIRRIIAEAKKRRCYKLIGTSKTRNTAAHRFYERLGFARAGYEFRMDLKKSLPLQRD
jgi:GNAT superfamily N-acetyltransferase